MEKLFETFLWNSRFFILFAVVFALLGSIVLFVIASLDVVQVVSATFEYYLYHPEGLDIHEVALGGIINAIDLYLIAVVLLIFAFGLYELFISEIDAAKNSSAAKILEIHSLDQLKDKIAKVIVMVLVVSFFNRVLHMKMHDAQDMLYFALSILALALGLYFLGKGGHDPQEKSSSHNKEH